MQFICESGISSSLLFSFGIQQFKNFKWGIELPIIVNQQFLQLQMPLLVIALIKVHDHFVYRIHY